MTVTNRPTVDPVFEQTINGGTLGLRELHSMDPLKRAALLRESNGLSVRAAQIINASEDAVLKHALLFGSDRLFDRLKLQAAAAGGVFDAFIADGKADASTREKALSGKREVEEMFSSVVAALRFQKDHLDFLFKDKGETDVESVLMRGVLSQTAELVRDVGDEGRAYMYSKLINHLDQRTRETYLAAGPFIARLIKVVLLSERNVQVRFMAWKAAGLEDTPLLREEELLSDVKRIG